MGELLQNLYNSVDALVVGNMIGKEALAAVAVCGVISNLVVNFFNGVSVGSTVVVSRAFGHGNSENLNRTICAVFSFAVVLGIVLSGIGILLSPVLLKIAGARPEYYGQALTYLRIYLAGLFFTVVYNNGAGILRAVGDSETPFNILALSCLINIVLDLLFAGVLHLGVAGVGLATVFSQGLSAVRIYFSVSRLTGSKSVDPREILQSREIIFSALEVGLAAGLQSALISFSNMFVVRYMNLFDTASVAGIGIAQRLDKFIILPAKSFGITMTTFVSQNIGAQRSERIRDGIIRCLILAFAVTSSLSLIIFLFAEKCVALFNSTPEVISTGVAMMHVLLPFFWSMAIREVLMGVLRGYRITRIPMLLALVGMVGVRQIFLAISMSHDKNINNIFVCYPIAWLSTLLLVFIYYCSVRKKMSVSAVLSD